MKKNYLFLILAISIFTTVYGQGVRYGFKAGVNISSISNFEFDVVQLNGETPNAIPSSVEDGRTAFTAGFFAEIPFSDRVSFQPEFMFSRNGNDYVGLKYDYLQLPLAIQVNLNKLFINAGPQPGLKVSFFEQSEFYKSIDFSAFGSIGYRFNENIFIEARYTRGFAEVFEDDASIAIPSRIEGTNENDNNTRLENLSGNNAYFMVTVGYRI